MYCLWFKIHCKCVTVFGLLDFPCSKRIPHTLYCFSFCILFSSPNTYWHFYKNSFISTEQDWPQMLFRKMHVRRKKHLVKLKCSLMTPRLSRCHCRSNPCLKLQRLFFWCFLCHKSIWKNVSADSSSVFHFGLDL